MKRSFSNFLRDKEFNNEENLPSRTKFWLSNATHDCFFVVGLEESSKPERIGAVKSVLFGFSEPLRAMLQDSKMAEKGDIRVIDVEPETFYNFLKCVYGAEDIVIPKLCFDDAAKLLYVFEKYQVDELKPDIVEHLSQLLSSDTLFLALLHPVCLQQQSLANKILDIVQADVRKVFSDKQFLDLSETSVRWIVEQENLNVQEIEIWNTCLKWAQHQKQSSDGVVLRSSMKNFIEFFRFLAMDFKDFCKDVIPSDVLTKSEVYEICKSFGTNDVFHLDNISPCRQPRNYGNSPTFWKKLFKKQ